jgi:hypothetical protein
LETALLTLAGLLLIFPTVVSALVSALFGPQFPYGAYVGLLLTAGVLARQYFSTQAVPPKAQMQ